MWKHTWMDEEVWVDEGKDAWEVTSVDQWVESVDEWMNGFFIISSITTKNPEVELLAYLIRAPSTQGDIPNTEGKTGVAPSK